MQVDSKPARGERKKKKERKVFVEDEETWVHSRAAEDLGFLFLILLPFAFTPNLPIIVLLKPLMWLTPSICKIHLK